MKLSSGKVSIITPLHNTRDYISETISSVLKQTYQDWELLIVDDASDDDSVQIVTAFTENDSRIKLIQLTENSGAAVARNVAIEAANGQYIAFLDSDDLWVPEKLEKQLEFMQTTGCPFTYTAYTKMDEYGDEFIDIGVPERVNYKNILKTCYIGCLTAIYDSEYFGKVTMPLIRKRQDYGLWLKLLKRTEYAFGINEPLAFYRTRKDSISSSKLRAAKYNWILYREVEKLSFLRSLYYFSHYAARSILRYKLPVFSKRIGVLHEVDSK